MDTPATVLLIDDDASFVQGLARLLRRDGSRVDTAANGQCALTSLRAQCYDVILCDLVMPVLDGPAFYALLRQRDPALSQRVMFITGDTLGVASRAFLAQCGQPYLYKPCTAAEVRRAIQRLLGAVGRATQAALMEDGTVSIVRRGTAYQVRYASNNPYAEECAPHLCPDEDTLRVLLGHWGAWVQPRAWAIRTPSLRPHSAIAL